MRYPTHADWEQARDSDQHSKVRELLPRLDWHDLWEQEDEEEWLVYPLISKRRLVALFSAAGVGKSLLMLEIAAALSTGRKVLGHAPDGSHRVLYVDFENDPRGDVRTRLQDMGYEPGDLDRLDYLSFPSLPYLDSEAGASALLAAVEAYGPELVVIDTISRAVGGEENANDTWNSFYKNTGITLKQAKVALIRLDHTGKDATKGMRGASAKSGDVDAAWWLSEVVRDQRYRLECVKNRFTLETKELTLLRHEFPLHHSVEDIGAGGGDREAKILELIGRANRDGLPDSTGRDKLREWATGHGLKVRNDVLSQVAKRRKTRGGLVFTPTRPDATRREDLSPTSGTGAQNGPDPEPVPDLSPDTNGKGHFPLSELSPVNGDSAGQGSVADLSPSLSLYRRDGKGQVPGQEAKPGDEPCTKCGIRLGWSLVRRGFTVHAPECPKVVSTGG